MKSHSLNINSHFPIKVPCRMNGTQLQRHEQHECLFEFECLSFVSNKGTARTLVPTNKNCALEPPLFGVVVRVSPLGVQWMGLAVETPPSWSRSVSEPGKYAVVKSVVIMFRFAFSVRATWFSHHTLQTWTYSMSYVVTTTAECSEQSSKKPISKPSTKIFQLSTVSAPQRSNTSYRYY